MKPESRLEAVTERLESLAEDLRSQLDVLRASSLHGVVDEPEFLIVPEVVEMLNVGERTLRRLRARRDFPRPVKGLGTLRWRRADLVRWMGRAK